MANGKIRFGKQSGGTLGLVFPDGVTNTNIVLPESGTVATTSNIVGFKNYIINGGFDVWQRSISLTDGYQFDRWIISGSAQLSALFMGNLNGETVNNKAVVFTKSGSGITYFQQKIEFPRRLAGKTITVSFKAYSSITMAGSVYFDKYNPTDGYSNLIAGQTFNWSQSWNTVSRTFTLPSLGTNYDANDAFIVLIITSTGTTSGAYLGEVQVELGSIATPFENLSYALQYEQCRRYYRRYATKQNVNDLAYKMRTTPTESGTAPYTYSAEL